MSTEIITPTQIIPANQIDYSEFSNEILEQVTNGVAIRAAILKKLILEDK